MCPKAPALFELHTAPAWRLLRFDGNLFAQCASHVSLCSEEIRLKFNRRLFGEHFKTRAGKVGRWLARSWNTILSPRFTVSTSGFGGFTRCSGVAFSYIRQHPRRPALSHQRTLLPQNVRTELNATWNGNSMVAIWEYRRWGIVDLNVMKLKTTS
jgi:hypothetical protein